MTNNLGGESKIRAGILHHLKDSRNGVRSVRWLSRQSGIPYSTLQQKLSSNPGALTTGELFKIADALSVELVDLYRVEAA